MNAPWRGALLCAFALVLPARAEEGAGESPLRGERLLERLDKSLTLKEDQRKKIADVLNKAKTREKKNIAELEKLKERMKALSKELRRSSQETRESIREQLDLDQKERFDAMMLRMKRQGGERPRGGERMRGIDMDPSELPPELRERMRGERRQFPPEMWHPERGEGEGREDLPPAIRERLLQRREMRRRQGEGTQRDVPPPEEWGDRAE